MMRPSNSRALPSRIQPLCRRHFLTTEQVVLTAAQGVHLTLTGIRNHGLVELAVY